MGIPEAYFPFHIKIIEKIVYLYISEIRKVKGWLAVTEEDKTIINKMMHALQLAKTEQNNKEVMKRHIANVKVLCELILEEEPLVSSRIETSNPSDVLTNQEIKAMIGSQSRNNQIGQKGLGSDLKQVNDDETTGDSLFDF